MQREIDQLKEQVEELKKAISTLQERIDEVEAVAIHQSNKILKTYSRQIRTVFFGFCCLASLMAMIVFASDSTQEKAFSTLASAFGLAAVANSSGALDSIASDLWKGLKR